MAVCPGAGKDADGAAEPPGIAAGVLKRAPRTLEKDTLLRIRRSRLVRTHAEEGGIEGVRVGHAPVRPDVRRIAEHLGRLTGGEQIVVREECDRFDPRAQVAPVLGGIAGAGQAAAHADDGDRMLEILRFHWETLIRPAAGLWSRART